MIKTLGKQVKQYKGASIATPIFMVLEVICETIIPLLMASIIDDGVQKGNINHIYYIAGWMLLVAAFSLFSGFMGGKFGAKASTGFARNLRDAMFTNIQTFSFANIDKYSTAGLVTRLTTDVSNLQMAYQMILRMFVRAPASLIVAMIMAYKISPELSNVYLIAVVFLAITLSFVMVKATKSFKAVFQKYDDLNESVQENVSAIRVVKAYVREDYEQKRFHKAAENIYNLFLKAEKLTTLTTPIMQGTIYVCILVISWLGAQMIVSSTLTTGQLMSLLTYCMTIMSSLMMLGMIFVMVTMSSASARRVADVLEEKSDLCDPENPIMEVPDGAIEFQNVDFQYGKDAKSNVLTNINFKVNSGDTLGIIGATGSGKTSLVTLISRLYDVNNGKVLVGGHDVREYSLEVLRNKVAMVLQKNELFSGSIYDNLRWGDEKATAQQCQQAAKLAQADDFITSFPDGYNTHIEQGGTNVSGGQKQRLCIARALLKKPAILILDDSTSAVDTATEAKIRNNLTTELPNMTKVIIAQRISSVEKADQILVLDDGKVNGIGTHETLLKNNEIYASVYESQTSGNGDFDERGDN